MTEGRKYTEEDRRKYLERQAEKLLGKIKYMTNMVTFGNRYDRNQLCPCGSKKKYKKCCIAHHDVNMYRLSRLSWALDVLIKKLNAAGLGIGVKSK